jgi:cystathionine beta-synthase
VRYVESLLDLVGNTPLLRLTKVTDGARATVLAKVEYVNPGGSVKDRIALRMVEAAEKEGLLRPGGTIVEPTSGNTGVGLAIVAQAKGYSCVFVCPDKVGKEKRNVLEAYGAKVVVCPTTVPPEHPESYYSVSDRLAREIDGGWKPDQYSNPNNPASHYESTGPEIWAQTEGRITHFVTGVGTGGTISGTGRYLKEVSDGAVEVVGADPQGSVYSGGSGRPYLVEGVGEDFWPPAYDRGIADRILAVSDRDAFHITRRLAREEALLVGGSSGMAAAAALRVAHEVDDPDAVIVVLLPDGGRGYLAKVFDDAWLAGLGFLATDEGRTVGDLLADRDGGFPPLVHVRPEHTVAEAVTRLREYAVPALPVVVAEPPVMAAEVAGSVNEQQLLAALAAGRAHPDGRVGAHLAAPLTPVGVGQSVSAAAAALADRDALLVHADGRPVAVLTRAAVLAALAEGTE